RPPPEPFVAAPLAGRRNRRRVHLDDAVPLSVHVEIEPVAEEVLMDWTRDAGRDKDVREGRPTDHGSTIALTTGIVRVDNPGEHCLDLDRAVHSKDPTELIIVV